MSLLEVDHLTKAYGALVVTDDVSFKVDQGEAIGVIGPNGAGKTTLFALITGAARPDRGAIRLDGRDLVGVPAASRCLAGVCRSHQIPQPFENLTVFENLLVAACFGRQLSEREATPWCAAVLRETGLLAKANRPGGSLTLLDRKRLEMARALATRPRLLLLDEIAGGLTEAECAELVASIRAIHARGTTIIWIEHVLNALTAIVDRLVVLNFGRLIADGPVGSVMGLDEVKEIYLGSPV